VPRPVRRHLPREVRGEWKAPRCAAEVKAPSASADCQASCTANAELKAQCTEATVRIQSSSTGGELVKLVATLEAHLPALIKAQIVYGKQLAGSIETLVKVGAKLPR